MTTMAGAITQELVYQVAYEANKRAAITVPQDGLTAFGEAFQRETKPLAHFILGQILENSKLAVADSRPMCGDTGLPRYYVKVGNEARIGGGFVAMERSLRQAVSDITKTSSCGPTESTLLLAKILAITWACSRLMSTTPLNQTATGSISLRCIKAVYSAPIIGCFSQLTESTG